MGEAICISDTWHRFAMIRRPFEYCNMTCESNQRGCHCSTLPRTSLRQLCLYHGWIEVRQPWGLCRSPAQYLLLNALRNLKIVRRQTFWRAHQIMLRPTKDPCDFNLLFQSTSGHLCYLSVAVWTRLCMSWGAFHIPTHWHFWAIHCAISNRRQWEYKMSWCWQCLPRCSPCTAISTATVTWTTPTPQRKACCCFALVVVRHQLQRTTMMTD